MYTDSGTGTAGSDYGSNALVGKVIAAGQSATTFPVTIHGDTVTEPNETFVATLGNVSGAAVADGNAIGTISNDDAAAVGVNKNRRPLRAAASSD